jgi:hypothetical protein
MNISFTATPTPANVTVTLSLGRGNDATGRDLFGSLVAQAQKGRFGEADLARLRETVTESGSPGVQQLFGLFEQSFRGDWFGSKDLGRFAASLLQEGSLNPAPAAVSVTFDVPSPPLLASVKLLSN